MKNLRNAYSHYRTKEFVEEYQKLCEKHGLCIVPTYEGESMRVVKLEQDSIEYVKDNLYFED